MTEYNFLSLVNDINNTLNEVELTEANFATAIGFYSTAKDAVNSAIRDIVFEQFEWPFNHTVQEETLITGTTRYSFPVDFKTADMDSFRIKQSDTFNNKTYKLIIISYDEYLDKYVDQEYNTSNPSVGKPIFVFRTPNLQYGVSPAPDNDYKIVYEYYKMVADLQDPLDVPTIPDAFRSVINDGSMYYAHMFRGDLDAASLSLQKFKQGIKNMRSIYVNRYEYVRSHVVAR